MSPVYFCAEFYIKVVSDGTKHAPTSPVTQYTVPTDCHDKQELAFKFTYNFYHDSSNFIGYRRHVLLLFK
jgi:hypothetical protein